MQPPQIMVSSDSNLRIMNENKAYRTRSTDYCVSS